MCLSAAFSLSAYFNALVYKLAFLMLFNSLFKDVCIYRACLFLFGYHALDFCIIIYTIHFMHCFVFQELTHGIFLPLLCIIYSTF